MKESGFEWIGRIPDDWETIKLRATAKTGYGNFIDGDWIEAPYITEEGIRLIQTGNIGIGEYKDQGFRYISEETFKELKCTEIDTGDVLICRLADPVGRACLAPITKERKITSVDVCILKTNNRINSKYLVFYLSSDRYLSWMSIISRGSTRDRVSRTQLGAISVPLPPLPIQKAIATYLDKETARIDALIAKKERQIELLQEKRQAIITRAITKGLDPKAKMKDSGVEWIGEIPEGWEVRKFSHCVSIQEGQVDPEQPPYSSMLLIAPNHIESNTGRLITEETAEEQGAESGKYLCQQGDVVYSKIRPKLAKATIAPQICLCSADMYPMRGKKVILNDFLLVILISEPFTNWAVLESDRVAMPKLNRETMSDFRLPIPPLETQKEIIKHINNMNDSLFKGVDRIKMSINLLREYRSSLITAAVSGQIDVSQEVAQ